MYISIYMHIITYMYNYVLCIYVYKTGTCVVSIAVAQLSINGTEVASITDRTKELQLHVKENEGYIILNITLQGFPKDKKYLNINYSTIEYTAC